MDIIGYTALNIDAFMLVLARVSGIFLIGPIFGNRAVPMQIRALLTIVMALVIFTGLQPEAPQVRYDLWSLVFMVAGEMLIGLVIGFVFQLVFAAVQLAGQAIDMVMGYSIVNVMDPMSGGAASLIGTFKNLFALLVFLATDSHHYMIAALYRSYQNIPPAGAKLGGSAVQMMVDLFGTMLVTGIQLAVPVVGALFVAEVATGLIARTMPQMPIFFVFFPVKIFLGFLLLLMVMPIYVTTLQYLFDGNFADTLRILKLLA